MKYRSDFTPPEPEELAAIAEYDLVILRRNREAFRVRVIAVSATRIRGRIGYEDCS